MEKMLDKPMELTNDRVAIGGDLPYCGVGANCPLLGRPGQALTNRIGIYSTIS